MLMLQDNALSRNPVNQIILNRTTRNPELIFNSMDPDNMFDEKQDQQWKLVKNCFYCTGYRYTMVYFNAMNLKANQFKFLPNQDEMMDVLDGKYPRREVYGGVQPPLIIVDGNVYEMCSPHVYCCFLHLNEILSVMRSQASGGQFGATELSGI